MQPARPQSEAEQLWAEIVRLVRRYAALKYGRRAEGVSIRLRGLPPGRAHDEPFPLDS